MWQSDGEHGAYSQLAGGGNGPAVTVDDLAADGEANAAAFIVVRTVQTLERLKYALAMTLLEADAIVGNG